MITWLSGQFAAGGPFMWAILACSLVGMAIAVERFRVLSSASSVKKDELISHINAHIMQGNLDKAISITSQIRSPLTNIVAAGLVSFANNKNEDEIQTAMDAVALKEIPLIERRVGLLATISSMSTLLGLLGTVTGLIGAFAAVANVAPAEKALLLSNSIAEAMNTTAFGLIVAIPFLAMFGWMSSWAGDIVDGIHESSVKTLNFIISNKDKLK